MKGDFSYDRFNKTKHFNRVLKQQGRVDVEADWNEQAAIGQHLLRTLITDLVGPAAGPQDNCGFGLVDWNALSAEEQERMKALGLKPEAGDFIVTSGRYYVNGLLVENETPTSYLNQSEWRGPKLTAGKAYLAYLDVWERHVSYIEDDTIREAALGGPDTTTRVKTMWQLKVLEATSDPGGGGLNRDEIEAQIEAHEEKLQDLKAKLDAETNRSAIARLKREIAAAEKEMTRLKELLERADEWPAAAGACSDLLDDIRDRASALLRARLEPSEVEDDPCVLPPGAVYRGRENHLYRIEIHRGSDNAENKPPTFKWSRENGSIVTRWTNTEGKFVSVMSSRGFEAGQWIELTDDAEELTGKPGKLVKIDSIEGNTLTIEYAPAWNKSLQNPKARRWDQRANDELTLDEGAIKIVEGSGEQGWIEIEDGIEVQFSAGDYRSGDYWLIPARVGMDKLDWPSGADEKPLAVAPHGVHHYYTPLAMIAATATSPYVSLTTDCRCRFAPLACLA